MPKSVVTWIVRFVDRDQTLRVRSFQTEEAALGFMARVRDDHPEQSLRSWAEERTVERDLPT